MALFVYCTVAHCNQHTPAGSALQYRRVLNARQLQLVQEAQLSPSDRAMRLVISNLANCHATVQKLLIRQVLTKLMV